MTFVNWAATKQAVLIHHPWTKNGLDLEGCSRLRYFLDCLLISYRVERPSNVGHALVPDSYALPGVSTFCRTSSPFSKGGLQGGHRVAAPRAHSALTPLKSP